MTDKEEYRQLEGKIITIADIIKWAADTTTVDDEGIIHFLVSTHAEENMNVAAAMLINVLHEESFRHDVLLGGADTLFCFFAGNMVVACIEPKKAYYIRVEEVDGRVVSEGKMLYDEKGKDSYKGADEWLAAAKKRKEECNDREQKDSGDNGR